jgi:DHA1 family multidrug resistance protein-like MFS transporter
MIGFGIVMPVVPFFTERLAKATGISAKNIPLHVGLLTGTFALMQFLMAPLWGRLSDRFGRKRLLLIGIIGSAAAQILFGVSTSLWLLYVARALGGTLSAATLPAAEAQVADMTDIDARARGMAWLRTAIGLGSIAGLVLGGLATKQDIHLSWRRGHFLVDSFSIPFFLAAALMLLALGFAVLFLANSTPRPSEDNVGRKGRARRGLADRALRFALGLSAGGQFGLAIFEATFALYARKRLSYGPSQVSLAFMVCGLVMVVFQYVAVRFLSIVLRPLSQIVAGFLLMGAGLLTLQLMRTMPQVLLAVGVIGLGMAIVSPTLSAMISKLAGDRQGESFGLQSSAESAGQVIGPLIGGILFSWYAQLPYLAAGASLIGIGALTAFRRSTAERNRS